MNAAGTIKAERSAGCRIMAIAVLFSLIWHAFWLSAVKVVAAPAEASPAGFAKVSFLGNILTRMGMEVMARPAARSLLEKRYLAAFNRAGRQEALMEPARTVKPAGPIGPNRDAEGRMAYLVEEAVTGAKAEPDYGSE